MGIPKGRSQSVEAIAATFRFSGTEADLLAHIGNLALHSTIKYWSMTQGGWRPLIESAEVVADATGRQVGTALAPGDFAVGKTNYYAESVSYSGRTIYRLRTLSRSMDRIIIATENVSPIRVWGLTMFEPEALQSVIFLEGHVPGSGVAG